VCAGAGAGSSSTKVPEKVPVKVPGSLGAKPSQVVNAKSLPCFG